MLEGKKRTACSSQESREVVSGEYAAYANLSGETVIAPTVPLARGFQAAKADVVLEGARMLPLGRIIFRDAQGEIHVHRMIPQIPAAFAVLLAAWLGFGSSQGSEPGRFVSGGSVTLRLEYSSGSVCELTAHVDVWTASKGQPSVALLCGAREAHRTLTSQEADDFLHLARDSQLFRARGIGRDGRGGDAWLATLKVTDGGLVVVLVVSGNREFDSGPRRDVVEFLQKLFTELRPRLESTNRK